MGVGSLFCDLPYGKGKSREICKAEWEGGRCYQFVQARGWCNTHWSQWRRHGYVTKPRETRRRLDIKVCLVDGCGRKAVRAPGYCQSHCRLLDKGEDLRPLVPPEPVTIEKLLAKAAEFNGLCLDATPSPGSRKLRWKCEDGHVFNAKWGKVLRGQWCPECSSSRGERQCRAILELMFKTEFPTRRPAWLRGVNKRSFLELDGYSEELCIAFEHQGVQHYEPTYAYGKHGGWVYSETGVAGQQIKDAEKRRRCWDRGVRLIIVPAIKKPDNIDAVVNQIELAVISAGLKIPKGWKRPTNISEIWRPKRVAVPDFIHQRAGSFGGVCLSDTYSTGSEMLVWKCSAGHEWSTSWFRVQGGRWCPHPVCRKQRKVDSGVVESFVKNRLPKIHDICREKRDRKLATVKDEWLNPDSTMSSGQLASLAGLCDETLRRHLGDRPIRHLMPSRLLRNNKLALIKEEWTSPASSKTNAELAAIAGFTIQWVRKHLGPRPLPLLSSVED